MIPMRGLYGKNSCESDTAWMIRGARQRTASLISRLALLQSLERLERLQGDSVHQHQSYIGFCTETGDAYSVARANDSFVL